MDAPYEPFQDDKDFFPQYAQPFKSSRSRDKFDDKTGNLVSRVLGNDRKEIIEDFFYRESRIDVDVLQSYKDFFNAKSLGEFLTLLRPGRRGGVVPGHSAKLLHEAKDRMFLTVWFYSLDEHDRRAIADWASGKANIKKPNVLRQLEYLWPDLPSLEEYYGTLRWRLNAEAMRQFIHERHYPEEFDHLPED